MSRERVLLTGATGFLGSHIADALLKKGYAVTAIRRSSSSMLRLVQVAEQIDWINSDEIGWEDEVAARQITILIHSAWLGVSAGQRDDWPGQLSNINFTLKLLRLLTQGPIRQVVVLGSQGEYGIFNGRITEEYPATPITAYGATKLATLCLVRTFCENNTITWHWLRVFAAFGPREDEHWFVSHIISNLLAQQNLQLTACEQRYDYSFAPDLARFTIAVLGADRATSGVYNLCSDTAVSLKTIVQHVQKLINSTGDISYGSLPYRNGQVMYMEGDFSKFEGVFGKINRTPLVEALAETVDFWRRKYISSN